MKIIVCVKIAMGEINPFDECAMEEALKIKDAEVTVISMAPPSAKEILMPLTRLGVKKVILLSDSLYAGSDTLATSHILASIISKMDYDMVFCGRQSVDGDTAQVGPELSVNLGASLITNVLNLEVNKNQVACTTRFGEEAAPLPAVLTIERINTLRLPSIFSKPGEVEIIDNTTVGATPERCGLSGSPTKVLKSFENTSGRRKCQFITADEFMDKFNAALKEECTELVFPNSGEKLDSVWAIGHTVYDKALSISKEVVLIEETNTNLIVQMAMEQKPDVILWNADLWGRKTAPVAAAMLGTGLCADCTKLEVENKELMMYRPARSGNIIAKIKCTSSPVMATVRCKNPSSDIIVSGGRGITDDTDKLKSLAQKLGGELGASRAMVDKGIIPYEAQVGLTGRTVAPKIYIAIGISGAVQHTCAIENTGYIFAVNPDKDAQIFEYADYGIISDFEEFYNKIIN